ncbi:MAG: hypothetical protein OHK0022_23210 [Roseiflexaceae bacterium]
MVDKGNIEYVAKLSPLQQGILFHTIYAPTSGVYVVQHTAVLQGALDTGAFRRAWERVVERHAALRSSFFWEESDKPLQVMHRQVALPWEQFDWRGLAADEQRTRLAALGHAERERGFDLNAAPLMRWKLIQLDHERHALLWTYHHLLMDGWCQSLLFGEIFTLYQGYTRGVEPPLPRVRPYREYLAWLQNQKLELAEGFWRQTLAGFDTPTPLPLARPAQPGGPGGAGAEEHTLTPEASAALQALARQHELTLNTVFQGAWALLLHQHTQERDLVFGITVSGRPAALPGSDTMIGLFINTLPLRVAIKPADQLAGWLAAIQGSQARIRQYEYSPLVQVQGWSELPRGVPLFKTILVFENYPVDETIHSTSSALQIEQVDSVEQTNFPLALFVVPGQRITLRLLYDQADYSVETVRLLLERLAVLLEAMAAGGAQRLSDLSCLPPRERQHLLEDWNATAARLPEPLTAPARIAAQAARTPEALALRAYDSSVPPMRYAELLDAASRLARHLVAHGARPDTLVALALDRTPAALVALLATMLAGAAALPLDLENPPARNALILADARPALVLTSGARSEALTLDGLPVLRIEDLPDQAPPVALPEPAPDHLAYVLYTSGSTGRPKGVAIPHQALGNLLAGLTPSLPLSTTDTALALTTLTFDIALLEILLPWTQGACVLLAPTGLGADGPALAGLIESGAVSLVQATPTTWSLVRASGAKAPPSGTTVLSGGEPLPPALAAWLPSGDAQVWNMYGPTETTIWSTHAPVTGEAVTIGRPIANTLVYVLDDALRPTPIGVPGELYIGGMGLARGYLGRPDLTAERFVPNPFGVVGAGGGGTEPRTKNQESGTGNAETKTQNSRLYRTGDLARWLPNGTLEHLGRRDTQIKLRGYRIELDEIAATVSQCPQVAEAVAVLTGAGETARLVAYVVPIAAESAAAAADPGVWAARVRTAVASRLPGYMVPGGWVVLEQLPRTANGKVDRRALPAGAQEALAGGSGGPPRTPVEARLVEAWATVLGRANVGVDDNFFDLGGHSLLALRLLARLRDTFKIKLPLRTLFEAPTAAQLAPLIELALQTGSETELDIRPVADLRAEAVLDPSIHPGDTAVPLAGSPATVLLTGPNGFLGSFILDELLRQTSATIYCLVRADTPEAARQKIRAGLSAARPWSPELDQRIVPLIGDLARPLLGLTPSLFDELAEQLDAIYHNGALVNFVYPYSVMRAPNVLGSQEALRLAAQGRLKPLHFVSTTTVCFAQGRPHGATITEDDPLVEHQGLPNGYGQSKWVAEQLMQEARRRGLPVSVYRPGRIAWHSQTGAWNHQDLLYRLIAGCLELGSAPDLAQRTEITPVDYVSRAIVHLSLQPRSLGQTFHLVHPQMVEWRAIIGQLAEAGRPLALKPYAAWLSELQGAVATSGASALQPLLALGQVQEHKPGDRSPQELAFDTTNTRAGLADSSITLPALDTDLFRALLKQMGHTERNS